MAVALVAGGTVRVTEAIARHAVEVLVGQPGHRHCLQGSA